MTLASILVVDADAAARSQIAYSLRELGHDVSESANAIAAMAAVRSVKPDLMVCDCSLPDFDGVELLSSVRGSGEFPKMRVVMTAERDSSGQAVSALKSGADDFVAKPLDIAEFLARVDACLKRPANHHDFKELHAGAITIDVVGHRVSVDGAFISLAPREYQLLLFLISNQDRVYSRKQLLLHVWDKDSAVGPRTVDVHIRRLRSLLQPFKCAGYLQTVRGSGYRFSLQQ